MSQAPLTSRPAVTRREAVVTRARTARPSIGLLLAFVLVAGSCGERGSGELVTEDRAVEPFEALEVSSGVTVELIVHPSASRSVSVTYDDNLIDNVVTRVRGETLIIGLDESVAVFGGGRVVNVTSETLIDIDVSGGSTINASGNAQAYRLDASGGADVNLRNLEASEVLVEASGGAEVRIHATALAEGEASGGAEVTVYGDPARLEIDTSGGAELHTGE